MRHRIGYAFRIAFAEYPYDNLTIYILTTLFVLLSVSVNSFHPLPYKDADPICLRSLALS